MVYKLKIPGFIKIIFIILIMVSVTASSLYLMKNPLAYYDANHSYCVNNAGKRIAFIIPGAAETESKFKTIESYYKEIGITPVFINMDWRLMHITDFVQYGGNEISKAASLYPGREFYFFGFSFGAVVALKNTEKYNSKGTLICSLSPVFQNDIASSVPKTVAGLVNFKFPGYPDIIQETTVFLYGDRDNSAIRSDRLVKKRKNIYPKSRFEIVRGGSHDVSGAAYLEKIKQEINKYKEADSK